MIELIRVIHERDEDTWVMTSPDVPGWTGGADSFEEARHLAEEGVRFTLGHEDVEVRHFIPAPV